MKGRALDFLGIGTPNTGQLSPLLHTFVEFRPIVNRVVARQSTDGLTTNVQFSPNKPHSHMLVVIETNPTCYWTSRKDK